MFISQQDLASYKETGFLLIPNIVSGDTKKLCADDGCSIYQQVKYEKIKRSQRFIEFTPDYKVYDLFKNEYLVDGASKLLGTKNISLYLNRLLLRDEYSREEVQVHQDMPYFHGYPRKVSVFVALTPITHQNSPLTYLKASHQYGPIQRGTINLKSFEHFEEFTPLMEIGDAIFVDFLTWHFSSKWIGPSPRLLLQIVYQPSCDGSYGGHLLGVPEPCLVKGSWETNAYSCYNQITIPDGLENKSNVK